MLNYYLKAKEEGWKAPTYTADVTFRDKEQFTIHIEGSWWDLLQYGVKYSNYHLTSEWKIFKNNKEIDSFEYYEFFTSVIEISQNSYGENNDN